MLDWLINCDKELLLLCNSYHCSWLDNFFWIVTAKWSNIFVLLPLLCLLFYKRKWNEALLVVLGILFVVLLCDQIASSIFKPLFHRLRPSQDNSLAVILVNGYRGGRYGFISSHAANTFGVAIFLMSIFRNRLFSISIILWAVLVSYSRIYLGVHYPGDILGGMVVGIIVGVFIYHLYLAVRLQLIRRGHLADNAIPYRNYKAVTYFALCIPLLFVLNAVVNIIIYW